MDGKGPRPLRTFGRRGGRALSARQQAFIDELLPKLSVPFSAEGELDPTTLFDVPKEVWLEIGFGGGEHLVGQAAAHSDIGFIGCEPFIEGMAKALTGIDEAGLHNVRLHMDDARAMMAALSSSSIARTFILFPDPWPKKRQQKRRLIQQDFLDELARISQPGAQVRFATDVKSYAGEALQRFLDHGSFSWLAERADDWRMPPSDHLTTRYEEKKLGDCAPVWLDFRVN